MVYNSKNGEIDLENIVRLYPAAVINMYGETAEMSLEWMDDYGEKVELLHYVLVFDYTKPGENEKNRVALEFENKEDLFATMEEVAQLFQS